MAERFGQTSTAERLKVGCIIANEDGIISEGTNGMPPSWTDEVCEEKEYFDPNSSSHRILEFPWKDESKYTYRLKTKSECRHAEVSALEKLWNKTATARGAMMFVSHSPCYPCAIKILTAGIKEVYYKHDYRSPDGIKHLTKNGVKVTKIKLED